MPIQRVYRKSPDQVYNFNSSEIITNKGILELHGFATRSSGAITTTYNIAEDNPYSQPQGTRTPDSTSASQVLLQTFTFDSKQFTRPVIIDGSPIINLSHATIGNAGGGIASFLRLYLINLDGSTETELARVESERVGVGAGVTVVNTRCLKISPSRTTIPVGNQIRLKIEAYGEGASGNGGAVGIAHDPQNRDISATSPSSFALTASTNPSKLTVSIPCRINL